MTDIRSLSNGPGDHVTRMWLNGCFDGFHYGHANAIRQTLTLVPGRVVVIAGVHSDAEITRNKGPPLFEEKERYALVANCRWVSRVEYDVPYVTQANEFEKYDIDFIVHGDDLATDPYGNDCYAIPKALGRYMGYKRTEGVSTTSLIQRVLCPETRQIHDEDRIHLGNLLKSFSSSCNPPLPIVDFTKENIGVDNKLFDIEVDVGHDVVVAFISANWDCFCAAHIDLLRRARDAVAQSRAQGERQVEVKLVVGIWGEPSIEGSTSEKPLLPPLEQALSVAQCRYTDAILLNAGNVVPAKRLASLGIGTVVLVAGNARPSEPEKSTVSYLELPPEGVNHQEFYTVGRLRARVEGNLDAYEERQRRKGCL